MLLCYLFCFEITPYLSFHRIMRSCWHMCIHRAFAIKATKKFNLFAVVSSYLYCMMIEITTVKPAFVAMLTKSSWGSKNTIYLLSCFHLLTFLLELF